MKSVKSLSCASSASTARIKAVAEAPESAEFERKIAERKLQRRKREAEFEQERAQHENDLTVLTANKRLAIAEAKVKAIAQAMTGDEIGETCELSLSCATSASTARIRAIAESAAARE